MKIKILFLVVILVVFSSLVIKPFKTNQKFTKETWVIGVKKQLILRNFNRGDSIIVSKEGLVRVGKIVAVPGDNLGENLMGELNFSGDLGKGKYVVYFGGLDPQDLIEESEIEYIVLLNL